MINLLDNPALLLAQRDAARSALAEVLRRTYDEDMPDRLGNDLRVLVQRSASPGVEA